MDIDGIFTIVAGLALWFGIFAFVRSLRRLERALARMEAATAVVASDLAESVARADATEGPEGAAADAALRTGDSAEAINERQGTNPPEV